MVGIKLIGKILFLTIAFVTGFEIFKVYMVQDKIDNALRLALDSGIVYGTIADDTGRGDIRLDEQKAKIGTIMMLKKNLSLDENWNSDAIKNGHLDIKLTQNKEGLPRIEAVFSGDVEINIMKLFGHDGYTIRVPEKTPYLADYK